MSGFPAEWLALREEADARARDPALIARLADWLADRLGERGPVRVLDLGAGTGAMLRALAPRLAVPQHWVLADGDADLLARALPVGGVTLERRVVDLASDLDGLFAPAPDRAPDGAPDRAPDRAPDLVTASALLDLCGADWIEALADRAAACGAAVYVALSYDGREAWAPAHPLDARVLAAFHADQRRDKGLGPALGPEAHGALARALARRGFEVAEATSDWRLRPADNAPLIAALAQGTADAVEPRLGGGPAREWLAARRGATEVTVGHRDLLALPPALRTG